MSDDSPAINALRNELARAERQIANAEMERRKVFDEIESAKEMERTWSAELDRFTDQRDALLKAIDVLGGAADEKEEKP